MFLYVIVAERTLWFAEWKLHRGGWQHTSSALLSTVLALVCLIS